MTWLEFVVAETTALGVILAAFWQYRRRVRADLAERLDRIEESAWTAAKQTTSTGNGFATSVTTSLARIESKIDTHLNDHAREGLYK